MLKLPQVQEALSHGHERGDKWVEYVLDGSLRALDVCETTRNVLSKMKESAQDLESSVRRKGVGNTSLCEEIDNYMITSKTIMQGVSKCLEKLKKIRKEQISSVYLDKRSNLAAIISIIKEVDEINLLVLESILLSFTEPKLRSKAGPWSLVSKAMPPKRVACEGPDGNINDMEIMNYILIALTSQKLSKQTSVEQLQTLLKQLEELELKTHGFEMD